MKRKVRNPVAKFAGMFNRSSTHKDKTKYSRNNKHKGHKDPYLLTTQILFANCGQSLSTNL